MITKTIDQLRGSFVRTKRPNRDFPDGSSQASKTVPNETCKIWTKTKR